MILTTTNSIEGHNIQDYLGIVTGISVNMPKTTLSFNMKKYYESYEVKINEVKEEAFQKSYNALSTARKTELDAELSKKLVKKKRACKIYKLFF